MQHFELLFKKIFIIFKIITKRRNLKANFYLKQIIKNNEITYKEIVYNLNKKKGYKITEPAFRSKISRNNISMQEFLDILDVLGLKIKVEKNE